MVEIVENSDLLEVKKGIICHQTNCIGLMGAGIALAIKTKWPKAYKAYKNQCILFASSPKRLLGTVQDVLVSDDLVIANCFGQIYPGQYGRMTDYEAWDSILDSLKDLSSFFKLDVHFPWMIGCGLAGGDWNIIEKKIKDAFLGETLKAFIHKLT